MKLLAPVTLRSLILRHFLFAYVALVANTLIANESFDFLERFVLADDRGKVLNELIPGTEEFYYFSSLHAQQEGRLDEVAGYLEPWIKRHGTTSRVIEIQHRQALLGYEENAEASLQYLIRQLGLRFDHEQERLDQKPDFPSSLNPDLITWEAFLKRAIDRNSLANVKTSGLDRLLRDEYPLNPTQRRELLSRLVFPDDERLVGLIAAELRTRESRGFGEFPIHLQLTLAQLDELAGLIPDLTKNPKFVDARLLRLRPNEDIILDHSPAEKRAYLDRLWDFAESLDPTFNSLKASVLFQRLVFSRANGEFPMDEFLAYLQLPRQDSRFYSERTQNLSEAKAFVDLNANFSATTGFSPISNDESLVRYFLEAAFVDDETFQRFSPFIREDYLKQVFAETKLVNGVGDAAEYFSLLSPAKVEEIRDRVEISFSPENQTLFQKDDEVELLVHLKNVSDLLVKVYEVNAQNYYRVEGQEVGTDLKLDGLVANEEQRYEFEKPSVIRHEETFSFDSMSGRRGIWVVEIIGNGISSRALIRKGKLQYLSNTTPGGELIQVVNEANEKVGSPRAWFGGREYEADEAGRILLPFSSEGRSSVILSDGEVSSLVSIDLPNEAYRLDSGFFLEQETLLAGREASIAVRPQLHLHGEPVSVSLLEDVVLRVTTDDIDGVTSTLEINNFELFDDRESIQTFRVPNRLQSVLVSLEGELRLVGQPNETLSLKSEREFTVNGTDALSQFSDLYLSRHGEDYRLEVLGKSGEPLRERSVAIALSHSDFSQPFTVVLKSDLNGEIQLGSLDEITRLKAQSEDLGDREWGLMRGQYSHPGSIHAVAGEDILIPTPDVWTELNPEDLAIFEIKAGVPVKDCFERVFLEAAAVRISELPPGDYRVVMRETGKVIDLHVSESDVDIAGYALSQSRHLQLSDSSPLFIESLESIDDKIVLQIANADDLTRVHLIATRFLPEFDPFASLRRKEEMPLFRITRGGNPTQYLSGRDIGEEYRYILERREIQPFPGNMLERPGLLINPWELSDTNTEVDEAKAGEDYVRKGQMREESRVDAEAARDEAVLAERSASVAPTLQFLRDASVFLPNLEIAEDGTVEVDASVLKGRQHIQVVAMNATATASRYHFIEKAGEDLFRDLRLSESLDLDTVFTQQRKTTLLDAGESMTIDDLRSTEMEVYESLGEVYSVLSSLNSPSSFLRFGFVTTWNQLEEGEKRQIYSEHACHELHFFLARKDPDFFQSVVAPYLANKKDKTFLDHYLLGENLEAYLRPWAFGRLNIVERILLGQRLGGARRESTAKHVAHLKELLPIDIGQEAFFFSQALRGRRTGGNEPLLNMVPGVGGGGYADAFADPFAGAVVESAPAPASVATPRSVLMSRNTAADGFGFAGADPAALRVRAVQQRLFRQIESTKEWAENNYFELPIEAQNADLVSVNSFWEDYANWDGESGFYSRDFAAATNSFTEMMFALSVLDLPFEGEEHEIEIDDVEMTFTAGSPVIIFHEEIEESEKAEEITPLLVSQNFYRANDRFRIVNGEREDKFVSDEFLVGEIYGSQVVVTNPTSTRHRLDLLVQIPQGAIPVGGSDYTESYPFTLASFSTQTKEVSFYFPEVSGEEDFTGYPAQLAKGEKVIATGETATFEVVERLSQVDKASWQFLSQEASEAEVLDFLRTENIERVDLSRLAWRVKEDVDFFEQVTNLISERHSYDATLWSYGLFHGVTEVAGQYLEQQESFLSRAGFGIDCELVSIDPVERNRYEHLEYSPLVNARAHRLGKERVILNDRFLTQYREQLKLLSYQSDLSAEDRLSIVAYLFLQDRVEEALALQGSIEPEELETRLQYDYLEAYAAFYREDLEKAEAIATKYEDYPVTRWGERFAVIAKQLEEIGGNESLLEKDSKEALSREDPFLELTASDREANLRFQNINSVTVNYYEMDLELLFSSQPFVSGSSGQFSYIKPNLSQEIDLSDEEDGLILFEIPDEYTSKNVLVEVIGAGQRDTVAIYSNQLEVQFSERYGSLAVREETSGDAVSKAYVKVYAKMKGGAVRFFKDGYTDLRGKFDYTSLSTNELDSVETLSLMVMSEENGSLVREIAPPQR